MYKFFLSAASLIVAQTNTVPHTFRQMAHMENKSRPHMLIHGGSRPWHVAYPLTHLLLFRLTTQIQPVTSTNPWEVVRASQ